MLFPSGDDLKQKPRTGLQLVSNIAKISVTYSASAIMDLVHLKILIDRMASSGMAELEVVEGDERIRIFRADRSQVGRTDSNPIPSPAKIQIANQVQKESIGAAAPITVNAPMFGVCHLSPSPDAPPFASIGDKIKVGQTLCLIEAMKMFTSVAATQTGMLKAVLVESGCEVDAGQPLFRLD
jgi:acetyl-CoA carboxylase biotin carboxyl carrier protein